MSNDLISRSALVQSLRNNILVDVTPNLEQAIEEQPTAYDVDKVVERLEEKLKFIREEQKTDCIKNDGYWTPEQGMREGMIISYLKSLEIVKSGGIK